MAREDGQPENRPAPLIDPERCTGCGLCVKVCPSGALAMDGPRAVVARPEACEYHGLCEMICPADAIRRRFEIAMLDSGAEHTTDGGEKAGVSGTGAGADCRAGWSDV